MFLAKLKATVATLMVVAVLGGGLVYSGGGQTKPPSELDALRKENELLKVNLRVTLEKIQALESQVAALKGGKPESARARALLDDTIGRVIQAEALADLGAAADRAIAEHVKWELKEKNRVRRIRELDAVLKDLQKSGGSERAVEALDRALKLLREQEKRPVGPTPETRSPGRP